MIARPSKRFWNSDETLLTVTRHGVMILSRDREQPERKAKQMKMRIMIENNAGQVVCVGHVLCETAIRFQAQPAVGRPWEWFNNFDAAAKYTRGE